MLTGKLSLHDLNDCEAFCNAFLDKATRHKPLRWADREEALDFLITELWRISRTYDPARTTSFERYARGRLPNLLIEFYRNRWVDQRYAYGDPQRRDAIAFPHALDAPLATNNEETTFGRLVETLATWDSDPPSDLAGDLEGLPDSQRNSRRTPPPNNMGKRSTPPTPNGVGILTRLRKAAA